MPEKYLTSKEVQEIYKISNSTLARLRKKGLPYEVMGERTYRYESDVVDRFMRGLKNENAGKTYV